MFENTLLPLGDRAARRRTRLIVAVSLSTQIAALSFLMIEPLLYPAQMPPFHLAHLQTVELVRPKPPVPIKPVIVKPAVATAIQAPATQAPVLTARPSLADSNPAPLAEPPLLPYGAASMGTPSLPSILGSGDGSPTGTRVSVKPAASGEGAAGKVRLSSGITAGLLLAPIHPEYPQIAKLTRTEGTVIVTAIIDTQGRIIGLKVLSGPAMLRSAAENAIREARYRPYLLNGQPVEVETTISVNFHMGT
jgi:protein TonB